ncbi:HNH endonuclease [Nocardia farcinica]|uniref:HNH endonuclease n=1 Tax=Nocardia farcinica TaxID=37329 RepID=UPI0010C9CF24
MEPLEIEHIEEYATVNKHEFSNTIVLCAKCHRRKGVGPRKLDKKGAKNSQT